MKNKCRLNLPQSVMIGLAVSCCSPIASSLPDDNQQPINIQANRATQQSLDTGEKTDYFGNVVMTQGSLLLNADHVTLHSINRKVTSIIATGNPATLQQQSDPDKDPVKASANTINYQLTTEIIVLTQNANIEQPDAAFSGNRIEYNVATEEVIAEERVNMVFTPANNSHPTPADTAAGNDKNQDTNGDTASP